MPRVHDISLLALTRGHLPRASCGLEGDGNSLVPGCMGLILRPKEGMVAAYLRHGLDRGRHKVGGRTANLAQRDPERLQL